MEQADLTVTVDPIGNIRGVRSAAGLNAPRLLIGSHLDTVPDAGAFDGVLGVMIGIGLLEALGSDRLGFEIEIIGLDRKSVV